MYKEFTLAQFLRAISDRYKVDIYFDESRIDITDELYFIIDVKEANGPRYETATIKREHLNDGFIIWTIAGLINKMGGGF